MKALHPDLNPGESDSLGRLFHNAVAAYEAGDLEALRLIASVTENRTTVADIPAAELTEREIRRLQTLSESLRNADANTRNLSGNNPLSDGRKQ